MKTFEEWKHDISALEKLKVFTFKPTKFKLFLSRTIPYYIPFLHIRKRVILRNRFRYAGLVRAQKAMTDTLMRVYKTEQKLSYPTEIELFEWEVIHDS